MVTLKDIAARAGVSVSTVSLVLNDRDAGRVKAAVAERVRRVADDLGYASNLLARGLRTRQSHTLGLLSDRVATIPFAGQMLAGAQEAAWEEGFLLMLIDTAGNPALERPGVRALVQRNVGAMIFAVKFHREVDLPSVPGSVPTVVLNGRPVSDDAAIDWVVPDEVGGAEAATRHLVAAGHRRIAFCNVGDSTFVARHLRQAGYEAALAEAGIPVDPSLIAVAAEPDTASGHEVAERLLRRPDRPTAVFCFSDQIAFGFYQVAHGLGLEVPRDLSIVGFDNQQFVADSLRPGLTTVQLPHREMGTWAAQQVIARVRGETEETAVHRLMPCPLIERASVAAPADNSA